MTSDLRTDSGATDLGYQPLGAHLHDPHPLFAASRTQRPVFFAPDLGAWCVTRYEDVVRVARDTEGFSSGQSFPRPQGLPAQLDDLLDRLWRRAIPITLLDPPTHRPVRAIMNSGFTPSALTPYRTMVDSIVTEVLDDLGDDAEFDVVNQVAGRVPLPTVLSVLGIPRDLVDQCLEWTQQINTIIVGHRGADEQTLLAAGREQEGFWDLAYRLIADRRAAPRQDMISHLATGEVGGLRLTDEQIAGQVIAMIGAGHETSANAISNTVHALLATPGAWESLADGALTADEVAEEGMRLGAPVTGSFRQATRDTVIADTTIPAGALVLLLWGSANRDERQYPDADTFDPRRRRGGPDVTFGKGIHYCIGAPLARMELVSCLEQLTGRYPRLRLAQDWQPRYRPLLQFRALESLPVQTR